MNKVYSDQNLRKIKNGILLFILWIPVVVTVLILFFLVAASFMGEAELKEIMDNGLASFHLLPIDFTFKNWKRILIDTPEYLLYFWNGIWISVPSLIGIICNSALAGYGLARFDFRGKRTVILVMIILMLLPYQVTLTPNFLVLERMQLIGNQLAVILPNIFHPLGIVAMMYFMSAIPAESLEAARMEGAGELRILWKIAIPQASGGIIIITLYCLMDAWNMVEPILVLIQDNSKYPLSVALRTITETQMDVSGACSVIYVLPILLVFCWAREKLVDGIMLSKKE